MKSLTLELLPETYAICRLGPEQAVPVWATGGVFLSLTRTPTELSIVCAQEAVPDGVRCERRWRCLAVQGPLDFSLTGILASLATPLAAAGISIFALSTFDTDYLLLRDAHLAAGVEALRRAGHRLR
jgi:hypothetical protein